MKGTKYGGRVPSKKQKAKFAILKMTCSLSVFRKTYLAFPHLKNVTFSLQARASDAHLHGQQKSVLKQKALLKFFSINCFPNECHMNAY